MTDAAYARWISAVDMSADEYERFMASRFVDERVADGLALILVHDAVGRALTSPGSLPVIVCAVGDCFGGDGPSGVDLVLGPADLGALRDTVTAAPIASIALAVHLRTVDGLDIDHGLAVESAVYSAMQAGPEFARWRAGARHSPDDSDSTRVDVARDGGILRIALDRPERHNAIDARLRDELCAALTIASADNSIEGVVLSGRGPSFCAGGDLGEFGSRSDPASAHLIRLTRSPARLIDHLSSRVTVELHGAAIGGGIEMASFAGRVVAASDTRISLPEVSLGLIPGAGGTIGIPRRIGRRRTAALGLTGHTIDAATAQDWGLVDTIR